MHIVIYRWKVNLERVDTFREGWRQMTDSIYRTRGSLGSRLYQAAGGTWVGIAQWPDEPTWRRARELGSANEEAAAMMRQGIDELLSEEHLEMVDDLIRPAPFETSDG